MNEWTPKNKSFWVCFDTSNGGRGTSRYLWWFDTRKEAMAHRREQKKHWNAAGLSMPLKVRISK